MPGPRVTMISGASAPASHASSRADPNSRSRLPTPDSASFPASPQPACTGMRCGGLSRRNKHWPPSGHRASSGSTRTVGESSARWLRPPGGPAIEHTRFSRTGANLGGEHLESDSVKNMDRSFASTFNNYDYECDRIVIAPHSPCPILFGIRGDDPGVLPAALQTIKGESPAGWIVFETNQGTDDHVIPAPTLEPQTTVQVDTQVLGLPRTIRGGHVILEMNGLEAVAYEPSKGFRNIVRALRPGDRVRVVGSIRAQPKALNIEKLQVLSLV